MKKYPYYIVKQVLLVFTSVLVATAAVGISDLKAANYSDTNPDGSINVGRAGTPVNFTVLTNGDFEISDASYVNGNVGVGASGSGDYEGSGTSATNGDVYLDKKGHFNVSGSAKINGTRHQDTGNSTTVNTQLANAWADAVSLSSAAAAEMATSNYSVNGTMVTPSTELKNINLTANTNMNITGTGKVVLQLQNLQLNMNSVLTLQGTTMNTTFIIDIAQSFSLQKNSMINLVNLPPQNVLFNVLPSGKDANFSGGSKLSGVILSTNHNVNLSGGSQVVAGKVYAQKVQLTGGSAVVTPVVNQ